MSLENGTMSPADIAAVTGNNGNGNGWFGGDGSFWIIVLFLFAFMGNGWGNGWGGNGGGAMPYVMASNTNNDVQRGFDQSAIMGGINGLNDGLYAAEISRCNNTASIMQGMNNLALNQATNACNTNAQVADLKYTVATEACADRSAISEALRDVLEAGNRNTQAILDKMCQQEIDALKAQNANLQTQINLANLTGSQEAQTAQIISALSPKAPIPAYQVPNPYGCNCGTYNYGCGCGA